MNLKISEGEHEEILVNTFEFISNLELFELVENFSICLKGFCVQKHLGIEKVKKTKFYALDPIPFEVSNLVPVPCLISNLDMLLVDLLQFLW